jgi:hypothetical protein
MQRDWPSVAGYEAVRGTSSLLSFPLPTAGNVRERRPFVKRQVIELEQ